MNGFGGMTRRSSGAIFTFDRSGNVGGIEVFVDGFIGQISDGGDAIGERFDLLEFPVCTEILEIGVHIGYLHSPHDGP